MIRAALLALLAACTPEPAEPKDTDSEVANQAPVADAPAVLEVGRRTSVTLDASGSVDPDGDAVTFSWRQLSGTAVALSDPAGAAPTFEAPDVGGALLFVVDVADPGGAWDDAVVQVLVANQRPSASAGTDLHVAPGDEVTLTAAGSSDADGDPLTYTWTQLVGTPVDLSDATVAEPVFSAPPRSAVLLFRLDVSDGELVGSAYVQVTVVNEAPVVQVAGAATYHAGELIWLDATASSDPEGQDLSYHWEQLAGPDATLADPTSPLLAVVAPPTAGGLGGVGGPMLFQVTVGDGEHRVTTRVEATTVGASGERIWEDMVNPYADVHDDTISIGLDTTVHQGPDGLLTLLDTSDPQSPLVVASSLETALPLLGHHDDVVVTADTTGADLEVEIWAPTDDTLTVRSTVILEDHGSVLDATFSPDGDLLFLTDLGAAEVVAIDLQDPATPVASASGPLGLTISGIAAGPGHLYVAGYAGGPSSEGLLVLETAGLAGPEPTWPEAVPPPACGSGVGSYDAFVADAVLYLACTSGLRILDVTTPDEPLPLGTPSSIRGRVIHVLGDDLVIGHTHGIWHLDVSDPADPFLVGAHYGPKRAFVGPLGLQTDGELVTWPLRDRRMSLPLGMDDFQAPVEITGTHAADLGARGGRLAATDVHGTVLAIWDISAPRAPNPLGTWTSYGQSPTWTSDGTLVVAAADGLLRLDPGQATPTPLRLGGSGYAEIAVHGRQVAVTHHAGLSLVDLDSGAATHLHTGSAGRGVAIVGDTLWGSFADGVLRAFDISDPTAAVPGEVVDSGTLLPLVGFDDDFIAWSQPWIRWETYDLGTGAFEADSFTYPAGGRRTDLAASGSLVLVANAVGIDVWSLGEAGDPVLLVAHEDMDRGLSSRLATWGGWIWVTTDGPLIRGFELRQAWFEENHVSAFQGAVVEYHLGWSEELADDVVCEVSGGSVAITGATVAWTLPSTFGTEEIACAVGDASHFQIVRDRITLRFLTDSI